MTKYLLIQARNDSDMAKPEEHASFAAQLGVEQSSIVQFDVFKEEMTVSAVATYDAILVGGSGRYFSS